MRVTPGAGGLYTLGCRRHLFSVASHETSLGIMANPGWYQDPTNPGVMRWWDGREWTQSVQPSVAVDSQHATPAEDPTNEIATHADYDKIDALTI